MMFTSPLLVAYALPFRKALLFSSGTIEKCTSDELNAICLHELAHLTENRRTLVGRIFGSFSLYPLIFIRPAISTFGIIGLLPIYCVLLLLLFAAKRVGQKAEVRADRIAAELQKNEGSYARALLEDLFYEPNAGGNARETAIASPLI
jgi:Zn-dependent protease with chaperone function